MRELEGRKRVGRAGVHASLEGLLERRLEWCRGSSRGEYDRNEDDERDSRRQVLPLHTSAGIPAKRLHYQIRCANSTPSSFSSGNPTSSSEEKRYKTSRSPPPLDSASFAPPRTR